MKTVVLGRTGIKVPQNAFGALPIQRVPDEMAVKLFGRILLPRWQCCVRIILMFTSFIVRKSVTAQGTARACMKLCRRRRRREKSGISASQHISWAWLWKQLSPVYTPLCSFPFLICLVTRKKSWYAYARKIRWVLSV